MGQVNVANVLSDPDLVDKMTLIHREPHVSEFGENALVESGVPTWGVIQPASGKTLMRLPDAFRVADVMSFWVHGRIIADGQEMYPDVIFHNGVRYAVQVVFDWTSWGDGWSEGTCVRERPTR